MQGNTQISDAMVERGENAAHRWSALAPDAPFNFTDDEAKSLATFIISAALAGHVVVPREPTQEMQLEGARSIGRTASSPNHLPRAADCYRAMISAAPAQREG